MGFRGCAMNNTGKRLLYNANFNSMSTVLISGGTGLVGKVLGQALLAKGYEVIILTRDAGKKSSTPGLSYATWNVEDQAIDKTAISRADHIIHLAGAGVADKRWSKKRKQEILDSRVMSSRLITKSLEEIPNKVRSVIGASAIGWYGADLTPASAKATVGKPNPSPLGGEGNSLRKFIESDLPANDFLGQTCRQWEDSIELVTALHKRLVKLRIGIVLSREGGALKEFMMPLRFGIATILGSGRQIISWIHIDDLVSIFIAAIENETMNGVYNAVAPKPVSNRELVLALACSRKRFFIPFRVPSFVLKFLLGEMSIELLKSATVSADKILLTGFQFRFPDITSALNDA